LDLIFVAFRIFFFTVVKIKYRDTKVMYSFICTRTHASNSKINIFSGVISPTAIVFPVFAISSATHSLGRNEGNCASCKRV
jgi:hypothetical protein